MKLKQIDYRRYSYPLTLVILVLISLLFIEYKHPYFFLQDDNRDSYLPYFVHNYESLINDGEIALYNFHQFLGSPSLATGQSATLYPITYFSVFLSDIIFGHYFATIDIEVIIHLLIGAVGMYKFMRLCVIDNNISIFAGLAWSLNSFVIYVSNSWVVVSGVAAYFPWMLYFSISIYHNPSTKNMFYAVSVRLLLFYIGNVQYFIYSVIFEFLTILLYGINETRSERKGTNYLKFFCGKYVLSYIFVLIFSLPLLLPMWKLTTNSAQRSGRIPFEVFASQYFPIDQLIKGLFYPFLEVNENTYASFRNLLNLSHLGYVVLILLIKAFVDRYIIKTKTINMSSIKISVFIIPTVIALLWSTNWLFNMIIYFIPILNRFRWPFKVAIYLDFYLIVISTIILYNYVSQNSLKRISKFFFVNILIAIQLINFIFLYTTSSYKDFGEHHGDEIPLTENLKDKLIEGRIISIGFDIWEPTEKNNYTYNTAPTLGFNYATLWGLDYFAGYNMLLDTTTIKVSQGLNFTAIIKSGEAIPVDFLRKAGVCWYIVPKQKEIFYTIIFEKYGFIKKFEDKNRIVFYDEEAYPMIFLSGLSKIESKNYYFTTNTINLSIELAQSDIIIFNNIYNQMFKGYINGSEVEIIPINDFQFAIQVPQGKHYIQIKYIDPYFNLGIYFSIALLLYLIIKYQKCRSKKYE